MVPLLSTDRLLFAPFGPGDLALLRSLHGDPLVMRYLSADGEPWPDSVLTAKLARFIAEQRDLGLSKWKVVRRADRRFIGRAGFSPFGNGVELGFIFEQGTWGQGYATECARGLLQWIARERPGIAPIVAFAHPDNLASRRILEKIGMTPIGLRTVDGLDHAFYEARPDSLR